MALFDIPYLYEICLKTGDTGKDASDFFSDPYLLGHYYVAPYLLYPDGICYIAEYEYRPQGYIVAVPDTVVFRQWMDEQWLPPLRRRYPLPFPPSRSDKEELIIALIHKQHFPIDRAWLADYPAHLHIDLLPAIQRKGQGRILMDCLFTELARRGAPGLHLQVGASNTGAIAFYREMGFSALEKQAWGYIMGKKII
jgi:ribosomal protein S18 acetylase RimI-like enzyme